LDDVIGIVSDQLLKVHQVCSVKRLPASDRHKHHIDDLPVDNDQFGFALAALPLAMHVDWLMLIRVKEHDNTEILE
jgi:hypothetical protein